MAHQRETTERHSVPLLVIALAAMAFIGCHESRYSGDGKLTDELFSSSQRFVLTLGHVDLDKPARHTYRLVGLPEKQFTLGFDVSGPRSKNEPLYDARPVNAVVRLTLTDEHSRVIIDEAGPLNEWVWSGSPHENVSFVYRQGVSRDVPTVDGYVSPQAVGEKADAGWGSYFTPRHEGRYTLSVHILQADPSAAPYIVTLKGVTGGWE